MKISKLLVVSALVCFTTNALYSMDELLRVENELSGTPNTNTTITKRYKINSVAKLNNDNSYVGQMFKNMAKSVHDMTQLKNQNINTLDMSNNTITKENMLNPFMTGNIKDDQIFNNNKNMTQLKNQNTNTLNMNNNTINKKDTSNPFRTGNIEDNQISNYTNQHALDDRNNNNPINDMQNPYLMDSTLKQTTIMQPYSIIMTNEQNPKNDLFQSVNKLNQIQTSLKRSISSHNNTMIQIPEAALATLLMHLAQARKTCDDIDENVKRIFNNCDYLNLDTYYKYAKLADGGRYSDQDIYNFITKYLEPHVSNSNMEFESDYKKVVQFMLELFSYQNFRQAYYSVVNNIRDLITKSILQFKSNSNLYNETPLMNELLAYINTDKHNLLDNYKTLRELVIKNNYNLDLGADLIQQWYNSPIPREQQQYLLPIEVLSALKSLSDASFDTTLLKLSQPLSVDGIRAISGIEGVIGLMQHISYNLRTAMSNHIITKQYNITESNIFGLDKVKDMFPQPIQRKAVLANKFNSGSMQASIINNDDNNVVGSSKSIQTVRESPVTSNGVNTEMSKDNLINMK